jgi:hypothetical protein
MSGFEFSIGTTFHWDELLQTKKFSIEVPTDRSEIIDDGNPLIKFIKKI